MANTLCYNRGCGQKFDPNDNKPESCVHHPGTPVFHDAYKGWSCCPKKTTDFTEFLNIKGCTKGVHSNVKPIEPEKPKATYENIDEIIEKPVRKPQTFMVRPSGDTPLVRIKSTIAPSLKNELVKLKSFDTSEQGNNHNAEVAVGTTCKNSGCRKTYEKESDNRETCMHHNGTPVFHEGMKYWTCCLRKTSDFNSFLEQEGCTVAKHAWVKVKSEEELKQTCRYDWFQTGPNVFLNIYAKLPIPEQSYVEANSVKMIVRVIFGAEQNTFDLNLNLYGIIDVAGSSVLYSANKVEVKLLKAESMSWSFFALPDSTVAKIDKSDDGNDLDIDSLILK